MKKEWLSTMDRLKGSKRLIRGNHDVCKTKDYLRYFKEVYGVRVLDDMILSHIPLHRDCITERFQTNVHGHTHYRNIEDSAYYNVSVENIDFTPVTYDDLRERIRLNKEKYSAV
jgi:calcineurin-like phosphoesterase family protein